MSIGRLTCEQAFARLDDYVDRELAPEELAAVEAHLEVCAACAREFALESELLNELKRKLRSIEAPPGLLRKIGAALRDL
jgi:anti-sigma factor (TIGR02949 family)